MPDKDYNLQVRLTMSEKEAMSTAAQISGLSLSAYVRDRLRRSARQELQASGAKVAFLEELGVRT